MYCECGCGEATTKYKGRYRKFIHNHHFRLLDQKGMNSPSYKRGRFKHKKYWMILLPDYYSSNSRGYVYEHIYVYQEYNKCCLLSWSDVHHKDWDTENNMPWNLMGILHYQHTIINNYVNTNGRRCSYKDCETPDITGLRKSGTPIWFKDGKGGWLCRDCYNKNYHIERKQ